MLLADARGPVSSMIFGTARYGFVLRLATDRDGAGTGDHGPAGAVEVQERSALFAGLNLGRLGVALGLNI